MSLKAFHIFFISLSILVTAGLGVWALGGYVRLGTAGHLMLGIGALLALVALGVYLGWFLHKMKGKEFS